MPKILVRQPFRHADGIYPVEYLPGECDVSDRCAEVATQQGWAIRLGEPAAPTALGGWAGCAALVVASGPSLTAADCGVAQAWRAAQPNRRVITVNSSWRLAPWADLLYACDGRWWLAEAPTAAEFAGARWTQDRQSADLLGLDFVPGQHADGISFAPPIIHYGGNSGFQAINLAVHFGVTRLALLGFDVGPGQRGASHWHGDHVGKLANPDETAFAQWRAAFEFAAPQLEGAGIEVVNISRRTTLTCFRRSDFGEISQWP